MSTVPSNSSISRSATATRSSSIARTRRSENARLTRARCLLCTGGSALSSTPFGWRRETSATSVATSGSVVITDAKASRSWRAITGPVAVRLENSVGRRVTATMSS